MRQVGTKIGPSEAPFRSAFSLDGMWGSAGTSLLLISPMVLLSFLRETCSVAIVEGYLPLFIIQKCTAALHFKAFNWLPAVCLLIGCGSSCGIASVSRVRAPQLFPIDVALCHPKAS